MLHVRVCILKITSVASFPDPCHMYAFRDSDLRKFFTHSEATERRGA